MVYELSWLVTFIVFLVALVLGVASSMLLRDGAARAIWATVISVTFIASSVASVVFAYSWMFTDMTRGIAQAIALGSWLTGIIYTLRASAR